MTRAEISAFFAPHAAQYLAKFGGMVYASPSRAWIEGPFYDYFKKQLWSVGEDKWAVKWECRDFSRAYACFAQLCNALTPGSPAGIDALAVGEVWFHPDKNQPGEDHAINAIIGDGALFFIDPQNGGEWAMSAAELDSITFLRF
jgi:hypothetical protein